MNQKRVIGVLVGVSVLGLCLGGCVLLGPWLDSFTLPKDLPAAIEAMMEDPERFAQSPDDPLADVEAGTMVEDLQNASGCWGTYRQLAVNDDALAARFPSLPGTDLGYVDEFEHHRFDFEGGEFEIIVYQQASAHPIGMLMRDTGELSLIEGNRIRLVTTAMFVNNLSTGEMEPFPLFDDLERRAVDYLVTLSGDSMKIRRASGEANEEDQQSGIFKRFDCP